MAPPLRPWAPGYLGTSLQTFSDRVGLRRHRSSQRLGLLLVLQLDARIELHQVQLSVLLQLAIDAGQGISHRVAGGLLNMHLLCSRTWCWCVGDFQACCKQLGQAINAASPCHRDSRIEQRAQPRSRRCIWCDWWHGHKFGDGCTHGRFCCDRRRCRGGSL